MPNVTVFFVLAQLGLLTAAFCSVGILHIRAKEVNRPSWYYFVSVWLFGSMCVFLFSEAFVHDPADYVPPIPLLFRFVIGLERGIIFLYYRDHQGFKLPTKLINSVNRYITTAYLTIVGTMMLFGILTSGLRQEPSQNQARQLLDLTNELRGMRADIAGLKRENTRLRLRNQQLEKMYLTH